LWAESNVSRFFNGEERTLSDDSERQMTLSDDLWLLYMRAAAEEWTDGERAQVDDALEHGEQMTIGFSTDDEGRTWVSTLLAGVELTRIDVRNLVVPEDLAPLA
jgi:hypothetical protein